MAWDPARYLRFGDQRRRPALDLLGRIAVDSPAEVYDLGAGAGNVTRLLRERWPAARITGVDDSPEMLEEAARNAPDVRWEEADLASWKPSRPADVIFSNAALHWLDHHEEVFVRLISWLAPGGVLAVQMPCNFAAPSHTAIGEAVRSGPWRPRLEPLLRPTPVASASSYFDILAPRTVTLDVWETEYLQVLEGPEPVSNWVRATWLSPLLDALEEPERSEFYKHYAEIVSARYPPRADGRTLYPFRRLFIVGAVA
jgi:trans-aconitate 2-methyltransferase